MSQENVNSFGLPGELQKYFWDVDFHELTPEKYPRFIAERILNYGNLDAIKWLLSWTDKQFIINLLENSRNLNAKTRNYWRIILAGQQKYLSENE